MCIQFFHIFFCYTQKGDLNTEPGDLAYRILVAASGLQDTYSETENGDCCTNECESNSYTPSNSKGN